MKLKKKPIFLCFLSFQLKCFAICINLLLIYSILKKNQSFSELNIPYAKCVCSRLSRSVQVFHLKFEIHFRFLLYTFVAFNLHKCVPNAHCLHTKKRAFKFAFETPPTDSSLLSTINPQRVCILTKIMHLILPVLQVKNLCGNKDGFMYA